VPPGAARTPAPPRYASATQMLLNQDVEILQMYITLTMNAIYSSRAVPGKNWKSNSLMSLFCLVLVWSQNEESRRRKFSVIWIFLDFLEFEQICSIWSKMSFVDWLHHSRIIEVSEVPVLKLPSLSNESCRRSSMKCQDYVLLESVGGSSRAPSVERRL